MCDGSRPLTPEDRAAMEEAQNAPLRLAVINKSDLALRVTPEQLPFDTVVTLSAKDGLGLDALEDAVAVLLKQDAPADGSILTNTRQLSAVQAAISSLRSLLHSLDDGFTPDCVLVDAEAALEALGEITGRSMREEVVSRIFARFCVGK